MSSKLEDTSEGHTIGRGPTSSMGLADPPPSMNAAIRSESLAPAHSSRRHSFIDDVAAPGPSHLLPQSTTVNVDGPPVVSVRSLGTRTSIGMTCASSHSGYRTPNSAPLINRHSPVDRSLGRPRVSSCPSTLSPSAFPMKSRSPVSPCRSPDRRLSDAMVSIRRDSSPAQGLSPSNQSFVGPLSSAEVAACIHGHNCSPHGGHRRAISVQVHRPPSAAKTIIKPFHFPQYSPTKSGSRSTSQ